MEENNHQILIPFCHQFTKTLRHKLSHVSLKKAPRHLTHLYRSLSPAAPIYIGTIPPAKTFLHYKLHVHRPDPARRNPTRISRPFCFSCSRRRENNRDSSHADDDCGDAITPNRSISLSFRDGGEDGSAGGRCLRRTGEGRADLVVSRRVRRRQRDYRRRVLASQGGCSRIGVRRRLRRDPSPAPELDPRSPDAEVSLHRRGGDRAAETGGEEGGGSGGGDENGDGGGSETEPNRDGGDEERLF